MAEVTALFSLGSNADRMLAGPTALERIKQAIEAVGLGIGGRTPTRWAILPVSAAHHQASKCAPLPAYCNALVAVELPWPVDRASLDATAKRLERELGRERPAPRVAIDIDVMSIGDTLVRPREAGRIYCRQPAVRMMLSDGLTAGVAMLRELLVASLSVEPFRATDDAVG